MVIVIAHLMHHFYFLLASDNDQGLRLSQKQQAGNATRDQPSSMHSMIPEAILLKNNHRMPAHFRHA